MKNKKLLSLLMTLLLVTPILAQNTDVNTLWERWLKPYGLAAGVITILATAIMNTGKLRNEDSSGEAWGSVGRMTLWVLAISGLVTILFELILP